MTEASDRAEENREHSREGTLEDFREEVAQEHGPDGLGENSVERKDEGAEEAPEAAGQQSGSEKDQSEKNDTPMDGSQPEVAPNESNRSGNSDANAQASTGSSQVSPNAEGGEGKDGPVASDEIEEARREIVDEFGPDGLGKNPGAGDPRKDIPETYKEDSPESESAVGIGSFSQSGSQIVVAELKQGPDEPGETLNSTDVETSDLHGLQADSERAEHGAETRTLEAVDYGKGAVVRVPKTDLEGAGYEPEQGQNAIVQLGLRNVESEEVETVFARYNASDRRAEAYVGEVGGEKGSRYELVEARGVDEDSLVRDFQRGRCEHLQNVRLEHADEKMFLNVDDRRVELEDYCISTSGAHAVIGGRVDGDDRCKIEFDGRRASVLFGRDYPVEGMKVKDDVLSVKYEQSRNEKHEARLHLEHVDAPERPSLNQFDQPPMLEHLRLLNRPPRNEGMYQVSLESPPEMKSDASWPKRLITE